MYIRLQALLFAVWPLLFLLVSSDSLIPRIYAPPNDPGTLLTKHNIDFSRTEQFLPLVKDAIRWSQAHISKNSRPAFIRAIYRPTSDTGGRALPPSLDIFFVNARSEPSHQVVLMPVRDSQSGLQWLADRWREKFHAANFAGIGFRYGDFHGFNLNDALVKIGQRWNQPLGYFQVYFDEFLEQSLIYRFRTARPSSREDWQYAQVACEKPHRIAIP